MAIPQKVLFFFIIIVPIICCATAFGSDAPVPRVYFQPIGTIDTYSHDRFVGNFANDVKAIDNSFLDEDEKKNIKETVGKNNVDIIISYIIRKDGSVVTMKAVSTDDCVVVSYTNSIDGMIATIKKYWALKNTSVEKHKADGGDENGN